MIKFFIAGLVALATMTGSAFAFEGALVFKALNNGNPVDQSIPSGAVPYPTLTFNSVSYDTGGFWNSTRNCFEIPTGVSKIRLTGQVVFLHNPSGFRAILVQRSDPGQTTFNFFPGQPIITVPAIAGTTTDIFISSAVLPVVEGECYAFQALQNSGYPVAASGGSGTFASIEKIE